MASGDAAGEVPSRVTQAAPWSTPVRRQTLRNPIKPNVPTATDQPARRSVQKFRAKPHAQADTNHQLRDIDHRLRHCRQMQPAMVTAMDTSIAPMNHGFARPGTITSTARSARPAAQGLASSPRARWGQNVQPCRPLHQGKWNGDRDDEQAQAVAGGYQIGAGVLPLGKQGHPNAAQSPREVAGRPAALEAGTRACAARAGVGATRQSPSPAAAPPMPSTMAHHRLPTSADTPGREVQASAA